MDRPSDEYISKWDGWVLGLAFTLTGVVLSGLLAAQAGLSQGRLRALEREDQAAQRTAVLVRELDRAAQRVRSLADFVTAVDHLTPVKFADYAGPALERNPALSGMSFQVPLAGADREAFERRMREKIAPDFFIKDLAPDGSLVPAADHPEYLIIVYIEPSEELGKVVGFNTLSTADRRETVLAAQRTRSLAMTPPLQLAADDPQFGLGVIVYEPIFANRAAHLADDAPTGGDLIAMVGISYRLSDLVSGVLSVFPQEEQGFVLRDITDPQHPLPIFGEVEPDTNSWRDLRFGGRVWEVGWTPPTDPQPWWAYPLVVLLTGLLVTFLVVFTLLSRVRYGRRLEAAAAQERAANDKLRETHEEIQQFVAAVSHDLRTPLVASEMMLNVVRNQLADQPQDVQGPLADVDGQLKHMRQLIEDLIHHHRAGFESAEAQPVELHTLAEEAVGRHRAAAEAAGFTLRTHLQPVTLTGDPERLRAVVDNFVGNAVKYAGREPGHAAEVGTRVVDGEARFYVADDGPGVPESMREQVFEQFYRGSSDTIGTGLGLAIVKRIAEKHEGRVWVEASESGGAKFVLAVPLASDV